jgi:5'-methylthioadenosine phosphorylase
MSKQEALIGIIGGSGLYAMEGLENKEERVIVTPFGFPSCAIILATYHGVRIAFLPRHGRTHSVTPTEVNYRANIWALKSLGVQYLISVTAVGSLRQELAPGSLAVVTQLIDKTYARQATFFGNGIVAHAPFGTPTCPKFNKLVTDSAKAGAFPDFKIHESATLVTMEGPAFSTSAESHANRGLNAHLIGMTSSTESKLAREAEIAHCIIGLVTDYDSWSDEHDHVDVGMVMETMKKNAVNAQLVIKEIVRKIAADKFVSDAHSALKTAIMTHKEDIPRNTWLSLELIIGKYFK